MARFRKRGRRRGKRRGRRYSSGNRRVRRMTIGTRM